jgi:hypothetical protein
MLSFLLASDYRDVFEGDNVGGLLNAQVIGQRVDQQARAKLAF